MNNVKLLTVIIPTYNMEAYLDRCLTSLTSCKLLYLESMDIIVVNDGSKDKSIEIANRYQSNFPNIINVIDKQNGNYGSCINEGLKKAKGYYTKILDADDWFDTVALECFIDRLKEIDVDCIFTSFTLRNDKLGNILMINKIPDAKVIGIDEFINTPIYYERIDMHSLTYKTTILTNNSYRQTEGISYTDQEWVFYPMVYVNTLINFQNINLYQYYIGREGQTMDPHLMEKKLNDFILIVTRMLDAYSNYKNKSLHSFHKFAEHRIAGLVAMIYKILMFSDNENITVIRDFDQFLKARNIEIYNNVVNAKYGPHLPLKYIDYWRKKQKKYPVIISHNILRLDKTIIRAKALLKKIVKK